MLPFENLIFIDKEKTVPVFRQITDRIVALIREGSLKPGVFLPGTRQMAQILGVNRKTIIKSYDEMLGQDWIETIQRKGYRVMLNLPVIKPRSFQPKTSFTLKENPLKMEQAYEETTPQENKIKVSDILIDDGMPDPSLSPLKDIQRVYGEEDRNLMPRRLLPSRPEGGSPAMKSATARFLNDSRALNISTREILITRGGRMPLYLAASVLIATGEAVALSSHSDALTTEIFEHAGAEILRLRADENGIDPDHLKEFLAQGTIKALYIVPHCQYPTTSVLSSERRMKLLELMNQYNFWIIEDDFGYDFHYKNSPILPIASAAHNGKLIYIGNFDRIVSSALRIGFLVAPPEIIRQGVILQRLIDQHGDIHLEQMLLKMMDNGGIERHIMRSKKIYAQRCELFCNMLQEKLGHIITFERPRAGLSVYIRFEDSFSMNRLITGCSRMGLYFSGETYQDCKNGTENRMVFGFAALRLKELEQAVDIMVKVIAEIYPASRMFRVNKMSISAISA